MLSGQRHYGLLIILVLPEELNMLTLFIKSGANARNHGNGSAC